MHERVIGEIDRRIRRLEAEIEILEKTLEELESAPKKFTPKPRNDSLYYVVFIGLWMLVGVGVLVYLTKAGGLPGGINVPLLPYVLIAAVILLGGFGYMAWERREREKLDPRAELEEKLRSATLVLKLFYGPLKNALLNDDLSALRELADRLLEDPILPGAIERVNEGDPKRMAYALYLYLSYTPEVREEVEGLLEGLGNKPLRVLLEELLSSGARPKGYNPPERINPGDEVETGGSN